MTEAARFIMAHTSSRMMVTMIGPFRSMHETSAFCRGVGHRHLGRYVVVFEEPFVSWRYLTRYPRFIIRIFGFFQFFDYLELCRSRTRIPLATSPLVAPKSIWVKGKVSG
jgi:hypothetical protein